MTEICTRLDGIALAAARMVSISAAEVRDRLGDRFRLLLGAVAGLERHQTLRHAVGWSYDLLGGNERTVLQRCSVFTGGFALAAAAAHLHDNLAEYSVLDSLVRKSLVTADPVGGHVRYGLLETIRQFAEDQLAATGSIEAVLDRHARCFAAQVVAHWDIWDGPGYRDTAEWWTPSWPTCAPRSAGPPTVAVWSPPRRSPSTPR